MSKRIATPVVVVAVLTLSAGAAIAAWTAGSSGTGSTRARTLPTGPTPTATAPAGTSTVTVSFTQVSLDGSVLGSLAGGGYTVKRYTSGGTAQTIGSACNTTLSGATATLSCAETNVPNGTWSYKVTPVLSGWKGVEGAAGTVTVSVIPAVPSIPVLSAASDSGSSSSDGITNVQTPTVTGTADSGSTVTIYDGPTAVGSATAAGGTYSVTASTLAEGVHNLTARASNGSATSAASGALSVTIDITAPLGLTIAGVGGSGHAAILSGIAGTASNDVLSVTVELCATNSFPCAAPQAGTPQTAPVTAVTGTWTATTGNAGKGSHWARVTQVDKAGNSASKTTLTSFGT